MNSYYIEEAEMNQSECECDGECGQDSQSSDREWDGANAPWMDWKGEAAVMAQASTLGWNDILTSQEHEQAEEARKAADWQAEIHLLVEGKWVMMLTGHRPDKLGGYGPAAAKARQDMLEQSMRDFKPELVISGLALGIDQDGVRAAMKLGIPVLGVAPCAGQESKWPAQSQREYKQCFDYCEKTAGYWCVRTGAYTARCMLERDEKMVELLKRAGEGSTVLTCWNGTKGGTEYTLRHAHKLGFRSVKNIWKRLEQRLAADGIPFEREGKKRQVSR